VASCWIVLLQLSTCFANLRTGYVLEFQRTICDEDQFWVLYLIKNLRRKLKGQKIRLHLNKLCIGLTNGPDREEYKIATFMKVAGKVDRCNSISFIY